MVEEVEKSDRNWLLWASVILNLLFNEKSTFLYPGPSRYRIPAFPKVRKAGSGKHVVSNHRSQVRWLGDRLPSQVRSGILRKIMPVSDGSAMVDTWKGAPVWSVMIVLL